MYEKRARVNAKQKSSGEWYFDITVEITSDMAISEDEHSEMIIKQIESLQKAFTTENKKIVNDSL